MALTILQWNARGLRGNKEQLKNYILKACIPPDVICVEETFLKDKNESPKLDGYNTRISVRSSPLCTIYGRFGENYRSAWLPPPLQCRRYTALLFCEPSQTAELKQRVLLCIERIS